MDGRVQRGARNRQAVIDAHLALLERGDLSPTAQAIAAEAGVSTRSVFHHFDDLESLFADTADTLAARHWHLLQPVDAALPVEERVRLLVAQRAVLFERITTTRRAAVVHEHDSPVLAKRLRESRAALRSHLRRNLAPEFTALDRDTQAGLEAAASWESWEVLRRHQGLSVSAATRALTHLLHVSLRQTATVGP